MEYVSLGRTGLKVSRLCFGMMSFGSPDWKLVTWTRPAGETVSSCITAPIVGATKPQHPEEALAAPEIKLTTNEIARLEQHYRPHPVAGPM